MSGMDFLITATAYLSEALSGSLSHINTSPKLASQTDVLAFYTIMPFEYTSLYPIINFVIYISVDRHDSIKRPNFGVKI